MDATNSVTIALSSETYDRFVKALQNIEELRAKNWELQLALNKEREKTKALNHHLGRFLNEFEGAFDTDESCASTDIAEEYIEAAKYTADNFGRVNNRIRQVEEWVNNYLPFG